MRKILFFSILSSLLAHAGCAQSSGTKPSAFQQKPIDTSNMERAIFASGCFWGTEYWLRRADGVAQTTCGYIGGHVENPTYKQVCTGTTGHAEAVEVYYDPTKVSYEKLCKIFFETHDPTQVNRQGPDIGHQYRSGIFYLNETQKQEAEGVMAILRGKGYKVATELTQAKVFYAAEDYHQDYYEHKGAQPYCHIYTKRFDD
jgi:peptide methionine sulfoxide reductase msrA/msrB